MKPSRKEIFAKSIDLKNNIGLELGPLHSPIFTKQEANISYLDYASTEDLREKYKDDKIVGNISNIVDVDFILKKGSILNSIKNRKFDYIVGSHVIEHVPDLLGWLNEIFEALKPEGVLMLAIPDKRYTFDINRNTTTTGQVLGNYYSKLKVPSVEQVVDYELESIEVDSGQIWYGNMFEKIKSKNSSGEVKKIINQSLANIYQDCHCTVFTPESFAKILSDLAMLELLPFVVDSYVETRFGEIEFFVILKKINEISTRQIIRSIPKIQYSRYRELEKQNRELEVRVGELEFELEDIKNSRSWELTQQLRRVKNKLKK